MVIHCELPQLLYLKRVRALLVEVENFLKLAVVDVVKHELHVVVV